MIVRVMADGQYRLDSASAATLTAIDDALLEAVAKGDEAAFHRVFQQALDLVRSGERLPDDALTPSDLVLPPADTAMGDVLRLLDSAEN